jgi:magnesium-transporting ATPase (P-type)
MQTWSFSSQGHFTQSVIRQQSLMGKPSETFNIVVWSAMIEGNEGRKPRSMTMFNMRQHAQRVTYFVTVQLIALVGWILVQSFFSLSPIGRTIPFAVVIVVEAIWWIATLVIMFVLFQREYSRFVQAALELEDANRRLRGVTNTILGELGNQGNQEERAMRPDERKT